MNEQLTLSALMFGIGMLVYAFRNAPNPYIGVRFGYTYLSKEAWRKANTFAGIYCMITGLVLLTVTLIFNPSKPMFIALLLISVAILVIQSYKIAKETYEKEDLKTPVSEVREVKPVEMVKFKPYLMAQLIPIILYFIVTLILWNMLPDAVAIHFDASGNPDNYANRLTGVVIIPLIAMAIIPVLTLLTSREPMLIRFPVYGRGQKAIFAVLTGLQIYVAAVLTLVLLYNVGAVSGNWVVWFAMGFIAFLLIWIGWVWRVYRISELHNKTT